MSGSRGGADNELLMLAIGIKGELYERHETRRLRIGRSRESDVIVYLCLEALFTIFFKAHPSALTSLLQTLECYWLFQWTVGALGKYCFVRMLSQHYLSLTSYVMTLYLAGV